MKRFSVLLALVLAVGAIWSSDVLASGSGTFVSTTNNYGTITYKLKLDGDSTKSIGVDYRSDSAIYTPWVDVPVDIPFMIYIETRDADSAICFGPDTIHVGLFTAPAHGLAVDSAGRITKQNKQQLIWDFSSVSFTAFTQQTYFYLGPGDTTGGHMTGKAWVIDTILLPAADLKTMLGEGGAPRAHNLGKLRFGACLDDADSLLDSGLRLNCYIVFKDPSNGRYTYPTSFSAAPVYEEGSYAYIEPSHSLRRYIAWATTPKDERE